MSADRLAALRPYIGTLAVLLGCIISTLDNRITSFGLADVRGAVHAGFDEGAWITTAFTVSQMLVGPVAAWLGAAFGVRRVLLISASVFAVSNALLPLSPDLRSVLFFQSISGIASGTFIPLTIGFVVLNLPPRMVIYGIGAYSLNLELSLNIAASIEGWFCDNWSWRWIFWDTALLALPMLLCIYFGMPRQPLDRALLKHADWWGIVYASLGFSLLYAALDQGNRLDWLHSGLINGLLLGGGLLVITFAVHELVWRRPWIDLNYAAAGNLPLLFVLVTFFRFAILSTSFVIPQFLITVQGYRGIEIGGVLLWIALPQLVLAPLVATLLRFVEPRLTLALGFALVGCACFMAAQLTQDWVGVDFLPSQVVQAIGQSLGLTSLVWFFLKHLDPSQIFTFGAVLQTGRLFGAELGSAFVQTFTRVREQVYSNLVGLHVMSGAPETGERLQQYAQGLAGRSTGLPQANARATALLAHSVQVQASVLAYIDAFMVIGFGAIVALLIMLLLRTPPSDRGAAAPAAVRSTA